MRLLFINHTPYESFWKPLIAKFDGFTVDQIEVHPFWESTGRFDAWTDFADEQNELVIVVAHSFGCLFLPEIAKHKMRQEAIASIWIEPRLEPLIGVSGNVAEDIRLSDSDVILTQLSKALDISKLSAVSQLKSDSIAMNDYASSFSKSFNYTKALMIEHAGLASSFSEKVRDSWSWKPALQLKSSYSSGEFVQWSSLNSEIKSLDVLSLNPFMDMALLPVLDAIEKFNADLYGEGLENAL